MEKQKSGWFNHPIEHGMASMGIKTRNLIQEKVESGSIESVYHSDNIQFSEIEIYEDEILVDFKIIGSIFESDVSYYPEKSKMNGILRFPPIDLDKKEKLSKKIKDVFKHSDKIELWFDEDKANDIARPHFTFTIKNVSPKHLEENLSKINKRIDKIVEDDKFY